MIPKFRKIKRTDSPRVSYQTLFVKFVLCLAVAVGIFYLAVSNLRIRERRISLENRGEALTQEIQALERKNADLQAQISQTSGEDFLEREARERFNLKKPGEQVVTVVPSENIELEQTPVPEKNFFQKIMEKFGF